MANMLSVVSSLLAKVSFPKTGLNTYYIFLTSEVKHEDPKSNSAEGRTDLNEESWAIQGMVFPLKFAILLPRSLYDLPQAILFACCS